jgi:cytochrome c biogenesis protein CcmG/thiol:disulfide interchange protein DsbE
MAEKFRLRSNLLLAVGGAALFAGAAAFLAIRAGSFDGDGAAAGTRLGLIDDNRVAIGEPAPGFALASVRTESEVLHLSDFRGKAVVVNFYASWCGPCRQELPDFEAVSRDLAAEVAFIAVNVQESRADALGILDETGATFPAVLDTDGEVARRYGLRGMPSTYLLDADGVVRKFGPGALDAETLRTELREIIDSAE